MTDFETQILAAQKTQYLAWVNAGCPESWTINGRSQTIADMQRIYDRITELETKSARETSGGFFASQFVSPE